MQNEFVFPVRVYWEDTDGGGVVYYANYLKFMERARTEWLRSFGVEQGELRERAGLIFVIVDVEAHYKKPARYGDLLQVTCRIVEHSRTTMTFVQTIHRSEARGELLLQGQVRAACLDAASLKPRPIPEFIVAEIEK